MLLHPPLIHLTSRQTPLNCACAPAATRTMGRATTRSESASTAAVTGWTGSPRVGSTDRGRRDASLPPFPRARHRTSMPTSNVRRKLCIGATGIMTLSPWNPRNGPAVSATYLAERPHQAMGRSDGARDGACAALRIVGVRRNPQLRHAQGAGDLPPDRPHDASVPLGEDLRHGDSLFAR